MDTSGGFVGLAYDYMKYPKIIAVHSNSPEESVSKPAKQLVPVYIPSCQYQARELSEERHCYPYEGHRRGHVQSFQHPKRCSEGVPATAVARIAAEAAYLSQQRVMNPFPPNHPPDLRMQLNHFLHAKHGAVGHVNHGGYWIAPVDSVSFNGFSGPPHFSDHAIIPQNFHSQTHAPRYFPNQPSPKRQKLTHDVPLNDMSASFSPPFESRNVHHVPSPTLPAHGMNGFSTQPVVASTAPVTPTSHQEHYKVHLASPTDNQKVRQNENTEHANNSIKIKAEFPFDKKWELDEKVNSPSQSPMTHKVVMQANKPCSNNREYNGAVEVKSKTERSTCLMSTQCGASKRSPGRPQTVGQNRPSMSLEVCRILCSKEYKHDFTRLLLLENKSDLLEILRFTADQSRASLLFVINRLLAGNLLENALLILENIKCLDLTEIAKERILSIVQEKTWGHKPRMDLWERSKGSAAEAKSDIATKDQIEVLEDPKERVFGAKNKSNDSESTEAQSRELLAEKTMPLTIGENDKEQVCVITMTAKQERHQTEENISGVVKEISTALSPQTQVEESRINGDGNAQDKKSNGSYAKEQQCKYDSILENKKTTISVCGELKKHGDFSENELRMIKVMEENIEELSSGVTFLNEAELELLGRVVVQLDALGNVVITEETGEEEYSSGPPKSGSIKGPNELFYSMAKERA